MKRYELWLRFADALGNDRAGMLSAVPLPETKQAIDCLLNVCRSSTLEGVSALAAYESQIPEVAKSKLEGLKVHYGITDPRSTAFFRVHQVMDSKHREAWWNIIEQSSDSTEQREAIRGAVIAARDALWGFLDGIYRAYLAESNKLLVS